MSLWEGSASGNSNEAALVLDDLETCEVFRSGTEQEGHCGVGWIVIRDDFRPAREGGGLLNDVADGGVQLGIRAFGEGHELTHEGAWWLIGYPRIFTQGVFDEVREAIVVEVSRGQLSWNVALAGVTGPRGVGAGTSRNHQIDLVGGGGVD